MIRYKVLCLLILCALLTPVSIMAQTGVLQDHLGYSGSSGLNGTKQLADGYFEMRCYQSGRLIFTERFTAEPTERSENGFLSYGGKAATGKNLQIVLSKETSCVIEQY